MNKKRLLILGGIDLSGQIIQKAQAMGVEVLVTDYLPDSPGKRIADKSFMVSATDVDAVVALIKQEKVDGVLTGFVDILLPYYQEICEKANLPCYISGNQVEYTTDKFKFKSLCRQFDIPVVEEYKISDFESFVYPILIKPIDNSGARGVTICKTADEYQSKLENALSFSERKEVLVERYMQGKEATIFYVVDDGDVRLSAVSDRHTAFFADGVIPLPNAYIFPSKYSEQYKATIDEKVKRMFNHIGIKNGVIFIQSFVEDSNFVFYEMGFRLTGSLEYHVVEAIEGYNSLEMMINFALTGKMQDKASIGRVENSVGCNITFLAFPGKISKIGGEQEVRALSEVVDIVFACKEGDEIEAAALGTLRQVVARVFIAAPNNQRLKEVMDMVHDKITILDENGKSMLLPVYNTNELIGYYD